MNPAAKAVKDYKDDHPEVDWDRNVVLLSRVYGSYEAKGHRPSPKLDDDDCCCGHQDRRAHLQEHLALLGLPPEAIDEIRTYTAVIELK